MKKKSFVVFAVLLTSIILSSCESKSESVSEKENENNVSITEYTETAVVTDSTEISIKEEISEEEMLEKEKMLENIDIDKKETDAIDSVNGDRKESYDISVDNVDASSIYDTKIVSLPESINDKSYFPCGINNSKIIVSVNIVDTSDEYVCEYGLLNPSDNSYEPLISYNKDTYYSCSYGDYYVFNSYQNDMDSLEYYNSQTKQTNIIFNYINDFCLTENTPIIYDGKLYFDVYTSLNRDHIDLYEYDFTSGELLKKVENAAIPMASSSGLKYVNYDYYGAGADKIITFSDKSEFSILNRRLMELVCTGDKVFGFVNEETESKYGDITKFQQLKEDGNDITILSTVSGEGELLYSLVANDFCIAWNDETGSDNTPCVYDFSSNKVVLFNDMENCYYRTFLQKDMGMIFDVMNFNQKHQICLFSLKEN